MEAKHIIHCIPNSHIDVAWLWDIEETRTVVCPNMFRDMLSLMNEFPDFIYTQSTALFYHWLENDHPDVFQQVRQKIIEGQWEAAASMWVETDMNIVDGESLIRQHLFGQGYLEKHFDKRTHVAWLPDTFGFQGNLPQILKHCDVQAFFTAKMMFNQACRSIDAPDGVKFPHNLFRWQGIDGSEIIAYSAPVIYNVELDDRNLHKHLDEVADQNQGFPLSALAFGLGDHGGGPTRQEVYYYQGKRQILEDTDSPYQISWSSAQSFFDSARQYWDQLPIHQGEIYLENHRGCHTTDHKIKDYNRRLGHQLKALEVFMSLEEINFGKDHNDQWQELTALWREYLIHQFHDIICGSSIEAVHLQAYTSYEKLERQLDDLQLGLLGRLDSSSPWLLNTLNWQRQAWYSLELPKEIPLHKDWQRSRLHLCEGQVLVLSPLLAALGACQQELDWTKAPHWSGAHKVSAKSRGLLRRRLLLENEHLRVSISASTGNVSSIYCKHLQREILSEPGNVLQILTDCHDLPGVHYSFSAWNVAYSPETTALPATKVELIESGPWRATVRVERQYNDSTFVQEISLLSQHPALHCKLHVNWQETYKMLKVAFPVTASNTLGSYEIPFGTLTRPSTTETYEGQAKFENSLQQWLALDDHSGNFGAAILNTGKYGGDIRENCLRLTLLRSSMYPYEDCDKGQHSMSWVFQPYQGSWSSASIVRRGYELNAPIMQGAPREPQPAFMKTSDPAIIMSALKRADNGSGHILRLYESSGSVRQCLLQFCQSLESVWECNGLEDDLEARDHDTHSLSLTFQPFQLKTLRLNFQGKESKSP